MGPKGNGVTQKRILLILKKIFFDPFIKNLFDPEKGFFLRVLPGGVQPENAKTSEKIIKIKVVELVGASIFRPVAPPYHFSKARL